MERLAFGENQQYDGLEAAIHIARYSFARQLCRGAKVLDVACGEGYGSRMLSDWGAADVTGMDISQEAIEKAQGLFSRENVRFVQGGAESLPQRFEPHSFDLIVSFETIEHLPDPVAFLQNIAALLKPGGVIAISCPNDWWYFPTDAEKNPYHLRKYYFSEFKEQTEQVLGPASEWFLGGPITGFANLKLGGYATDDGKSGQMQMLGAAEAEQALFVPSEFNAGPMEDNASYFVGLWGTAQVHQSMGAAILPLSMDAFRKGIFQGHLQSNQNETTELLEQERRKRIQLERDYRDAGLRAQALGIELQLLREALVRQESVMADLLYRAARYDRIQALFPAGLRRVLMKTYRALRGRSRGH